jgi:hypothetical protein
VLNYTGAFARGDGLGIVCAKTVDHQNFTGDISHGINATTNVIAFIVCDDHYRYARFGIHGGEDKN